MIEEIIINYLSKIFDHVYMEVPEEPPEEYILVEKAGSSRENFLDSAVIAVQSYSSSLYKASLLNESVKRAMDDMVIIDKVTKSKLNSDYNFTDTIKKKYRYQAVYEVCYFKEEE